MSTPALLQHYKDKVVPNLTKKLGYANPHQVPRLEKIVVTSCMGKAPDRKVAVDDAVNEIQKITGQRPSLSRSALPTSAKSSSVAAPCSRQRVQNARSSSVPRRPPGLAARAGAERRRRSRPEGRSRWS